MKRLIDGMGENSSDGYDAIYLQRKERGVDSFDLKRWNKLLKYYRGGKLIDLGCLDSLVPRLAREQYPKAEIWGIDLAKDAIEELANRNGDINYTVGDVYDTKFPNNYFDYAVAGEILEHLDDPARFIKETFRILKHGGTFALSTPEDEAREPGAIDGHRHLWSFLQEDVDKLFTPYCKKVIIKTMGSQFFPYVYHWPVILGYGFKA